jgi:hypothetical protein
MGSLSPRRAGPVTFVWGSSACMATHRDMASYSYVWPDGVMVGRRMTSCVIGHRNSCIHKPDNRRHPAELHCSPSSTHKLQYDRLQ